MPLKTFFFLMLSALAVGALVHKPHTRHTQLRVCAYNEIHKTEAKLNI